MRWILIGAGVLVVLILAVTVIGMALPQSHSVQRTARLSVSPERVWSLITDVAAYPSWRSDVTSVEQLPPYNGHPAWREISKGNKLAFEATTSEPSSHFVTRITDKGIPFGGSWDYRIVPDGSGSRITITENGEVYHPIFRFVSKFVMGHTATIDKYLTSLSARAGDTYAP